MKDLSDIGDIWCLQDVHKKRQIKKKIHVSHFLNIPSALLGYKTRLQMKFCHQNELLIVFQLISAETEQFYLRCPFL